MLLPLSSVDFGEMYERSMKCHLIFFFKSLFFICFDFVFIYFISLIKNGIFILTVYLSQFFLLFVCVAYALALLQVKQ